MSCTRAAQHVCAAAREAYTGAMFRINLRILPVLIGKRGPPAWLHSPGKPGRAGEMGGSSAGHVKAPPPGNRRDGSYGPVDGARTTVSAPGEIRGLSEGDGACRPGRVGDARITAGAPGEPRSPRVGDGPCRSGRVADASPTFRMTGHVPAPGTMFPVPDPSDRRRSRRDDDAGMAAERNGSLNPPSPRVREYRAGGGGRARESTGTRITPAGRCHAGTCPPARPRIARSMWETSDRE
jgi:hypothetical protein